MDVEVLTKSSWGPLARVNSLTLSSALIENIILYISEVEGKGGALIFTGPDITSYYEFYILRKNTTKNMGGVYYCAMAESMFCHAAT